MPDSDSAVADTPTLDALAATADLAVAIASHDDGATIGTLVRELAAYVADRLPDTRVMILHTDFGSRDDTLASARSAASGAIALHQITIPTDGSAGAAGPPRSIASRPDALRAAFAAARQFKVRALAVIDVSRAASGARSLDQLAIPVLEDSADFVLPVYARHRFAGALTSGVIYPLTRALYGRPVRHPVVGEFACSASLIEAFLGRATWPPELARFGSDCWLLTSVLCSSLRVGQAHVSGSPAPASIGGDAQLSQVQSRLLGALFIEGERNAAIWQRVRASRPVTVFGAADVGEPETGAVDSAQALQAFRLAERNLAEVWALILPPASRLELHRQAQKPDADVRFADDLWARIVYDFALAHRRRVMNRDHLLSAFTPLYLGWFGAFVVEMQAAPADAVEAHVEQLCVRFEEQKPYVIARWRSPDRFNP